MRKGHKMTRHNRTQGRTCPLKHPGQPKHHLFVRRYLPHLPHPALPFWQNCPALTIGNIRTWWTLL
jgi:hypothetical protein